MGNEIDWAERETCIARREFSLGSLSPARHAIMACQYEISEEVRAEVDFQDHIAASLMTRDQYEPLSDDFFDRFTARLNHLNDADYTVDGIKPVDKANAPDVSEKISDKYISQIKWKSIFPGVAIHHIMGEPRKKTGERLYFMKIKGGMKLPTHSHAGDEWALILNGSYRADGIVYNRGDLHIANDNDEHAPHVTAGEDCICLVMSDGPLKMRGWMPRLLLPVIGL